MTKRAEAETTERRGFTPASLLARYKKHKRADIRRALERGVEYIHIDLTPRFGYRYFVLDREFFEFDRDGEFIGSGCPVSAWAGRLVPKPQEDTGRKVLAGPNRSSPGDPQRSTLPPPALADAVLEILREKGIPVE